ncbi:hypothetical protein GCM10010919_08280 [Alishewanella longhuensis]|uniref:Galactose oxidase n=1 Tax=Alishewanella longhuensis TaxID=1091037 RepID=A0ABQ3KUW8_9ALTE|nr:kelch repeat-containing protein [Alishewanella longhuensis]GHG62975.1 hypothetical protein GCM10010919_08280 [Alishewanella longhuensis]
MPKFLLIFVMGIFSPVLAALEWQTLAPMPQAVQEIYPTVHKGRIYVAGGLSDDIALEQQQMTAVVQIFDPATQSWSLGPALPEPRHHGYLVSVKEQLFLFGGFIEANGGRWSASADVLLLDENMNSWRKVAVLPKPLTETAAAVMHDKVHLASGRSPSGASNAQWRDQQDVNWHWIFDPLTLQVTEAPALEQAFNSAAAIVFNEQFYLVGGRQVAGGNLAVLQRFDPAVGTWQNLAAMPQAQGGLAAAVLNNQIWVFGGEYFNDGGGVYSEVWLYNPQTDQWQQRGDMPVPRHGLGAVSLNKAIYVIGGAVEVGLKATSAHLEKVTVELTNPL